MATRVVETYGNDARPQYNVKFWTYVAIEIYETSATAYRLRYAFWVNANGSLGKFSTSWGMSGSVTGSGNWLDSGWIDAGWHSSGQTLNVSGWSGYTGGSGTWYQSTVSASYTVPQLQTAPATPTTCMLVLNEDNTATATWTATSTTSAPITGQKIGLQINDGAWVYTNLGADIRSFSFDVKTDGKYLVAVQAGNSTGWSSWKYSSPVYTPPLIPGYFALINAEKDILVNLTSRSKYFKQFELAYKISETEWSDIIIVTDSSYTITNDITVYQNKIKVRETNLGDQSSPWSEFTANGMPTIWINIPEGETAKSIWIKGPLKSPAIPFNVRFAENPNLPNVGQKSLLLSFSFENDVKSLPEYFNISNSDDNLLFTNLEILYDDPHSLTLTQNEDGTYTYYDDGYVDAMIDAVGLESPYQLKVSLGNDKGESVAILSSNNNLGQNGQGPTIVTGGLGVSAAASYYWCYLSLDDKTYNNLETDPVTVKIAYKKRSETEFGNEAEFTSYEIREDYNQIYIGATQVPNGVQGTARIIVSNSTGESEPYEVAFEM